jgi:thiosulfate/3-mercaptopyruvate sulfurtransferase
MANTVLVTTEWLEAQLEDPTVRVIEVLADEAATDYEDGHIPGAIRWFWKDALWHATDREFATPQEMAERLGAIGVRETDTIVLYGSRIQFSTYALWVLRMTGHPDVRILDGSRLKWLAEGRPTQLEAPAIVPVAYAPQVGDASSRVGRDDVLSQLDDPGRLLLDVRSPEEYRGELVGFTPGANHGAERAGRIPGAVHLFFRELLNEDDTFKSAEELRPILEGAGVTSEDGRETVVYCRLSHRATLAWFTMTQLLGLERVRIYDGSWTEWGSIVGFPVERPPSGVAERG